MTSLAWRLQSRPAVSVLVSFLSLSYRLADDPSEMFTMIFGGEAFMDWLVLSPISLTILLQDRRAVPSQEHDGHHGSSGGGPARRSRK
jgi:hypothetical protein